jgi:general secretion pathway protein C
MKIAVRLINMFVLAALAAVTVDIFYDGLSIQYAGIQAAQPISAGMTRVSESRNMPKGKDRYDLIIERDLFKMDRPGEAAPQPIAVSDLQDTNLDIKLWGTVSGKSDMRYAVIELKGPDNRRRQSLFQEGEQIESARIEKIMRDRVVLNLNGENQVLKLEKYQLKGRSRRRSTAVRRAQTRPTTQRRIIRRATIERAAANIGDLMTQAKFVPHQDGMRIMSVKPTSVFRRMGLRNGDILTGVDGRPIRSIDDALSLYHGLKGSDQLSLEISRRGRPRTINYQIR